MHNGKEIEKSSGDGSVQKECDLVYSDRAGAKYVSNGLNPTFRGFLHRGDRDGRIFAALQMMYDVKSVHRRSSCLCLQTEPRQGVVWPMN
jgi:hypothetical protein